MSRPGEKQLEAELEFEESPIRSRSGPIQPNILPLSQRGCLHGTTPRGAVGIYYDLYPEDRPAEPEPRSTSPCRQEP
jgi:hypothetical protein